MPSGMMQMMSPDEGCRRMGMTWNGSRCVSGAYKPSTLAELVGILRSLFRP
jgi:hypothetical protein